MSGGRAQHWQGVYTGKTEQQTSWFRPQLDESLRLIDELGGGPNWPAIDVGAGRSTLVDDLLARKYLDVTALDISEAALRHSQERLGKNALRVRWLVGDVLETRLPPDHYGLWHDRAVFHFLTGAAERDKYAAIAARSLRIGGLLLVATFAPDGPEKCSGLDVCRYDADSLAKVFGDHFEPIASSRETHRTPFDTEQAFTYLALRRVVAPSE
jgi:SAM-dependent methyltransferase